MGKIHLDLRKKILLLLAVIILLFVSISGLLLNGLFSSRREYNFFLDSFAAKQNRIQLFENQIWGASDAEKSFLLNQDKEMHGYFTTKIDQAGETLGSLADMEESLVKATLGEGVDIKEHLAVFKELDSLLKSYEQKQNKLYDLIVKKGLDEESGLRGAFRTAAHNLEAQITENHRNSMMVEYLMMRRHEKDYLLRLTDKYVQKNMDSSSLLVELINQENFPEDVQYRMLKALEEYRIGMAQIVDVNTAITGIDDQIYETFGEILPIMEAEKQEVDNMLEVEREKLNHSIQTYLFLSMIIITAAVVITILLSINLFRQISRPMSMILGDVKRFAEGDLSQDAEYTKDDEMGRISTGLNSAFDSLRILVQGIRSSSDKSLEMGQNISAATTETSSAVTQILANLDSIKHQIHLLTQEIDGNYNASLDISKAVTVLNQLVEDQSSSVVQSSASVEEMMSSINSVSSITSERSKGSEHLVEFTREGAQRIEEANQQILKVAQQTDSIMEITGVINNIASQTNLLAMNAAIEAAHAGEAGKGFAVVADEIRKLAESASLNSKAITDLLGAISSYINDATHSSEESLHSFKQIQDEVGQLVGALVEIASSMSEMSAGATQVLTATTAMTESVSGVSDQTSVIVINTESITGAVKKSQEMANLSQQGVEEIALGVREIQESVVILDDQSRLNEEGLEALKSLIDQFKL